MAGLLLLLTLKILLQILFVYLKYERFIYSLIKIYALLKEKTNKSGKITT